MFPSAATALPSGISTRPFKPWRCIALCDGGSSMTMMTLKFSTPSHPGHQCRLGWPVFQSHGVWRRRQAAKSFRKTMLVVPVWSVSFLPWSLCVCGSRFSLFSRSLSLSLSLSPFLSFLVSSFCVFLHLLLTYPPIDLLTLWPHRNHNHTRGCICIVSYNHFCFPRRFIIPYNYV
uniref:Uncharacterized protein n=1 Tax=Anopheles maculatus TaxID=74869 RepID=A0A182SWE9_9DIPT